MPGDHHPLAFEGAVDQLRQLILGLCNAMGAHKSNIAIGWPFCRARTPGDLGRRSVGRAPDLRVLARISGTVKRADVLEEIWVPILGICGGKRLAHGLAGNHGEIGAGGLIGNRRNLLPIAECTEGI
jgi:hypothetical protein